MSELFKFLKKTNPNLNITFDKKTNTDKVNNSEEDIKREKEKCVNLKTLKEKIRQDLQKKGCNGHFIGKVMRSSEEELRKNFPQFF